MAIIEAKVEPSSDNVWIGYRGLDIRGEGTRHNRIGMNKCQDLAGSLHGAGVHLRSTPARRFDQQIAQWSSDFYTPIAAAAVHRNYLALRTAGAQRA